MSPHSSEEPGLFDLPLAPAAAPPPADADGASDTELRAPAPRRAAGRRPPRPEPTDSLPLFEERAPPSRPAASSARARAAESPAVSERPRPTPVPAVTAPAAPHDEERRAPLAVRLRATAGDLIVLAAVGAVAALGAQRLGAALDLAAVPPLALFLLAFSFLYSVISLAFWGQTPGMAWAGMIARSTTGEPLSFGQTAMRWAGDWLTWSTLGVAGLLALTGRSLVDRLSGSVAYALPDSSRAA